MMDDVVRSIVADMAKDALKKVDKAKIANQVENAILAYFQSSRFEEEIIEALSDDGVGWDIAGALKPKIVKAAKSLKVTV